MTEKVRLAPVGLGRWARVQARGAQRGDVIELVSCYSRDPEKRAAFQAEFGIGRSAASYEELLADPEVEGVLITTPNDTHKDLILQALEAGKGVYVDKPIAHTLEDGVAIAEDPRLVRDDRIEAVSRPPHAAALDEMRRGSEVYGFVTDVGEFGGDGWYGDPTWATEERTGDFASRIAAEVAAQVERVLALRRGTETAKEEG